MKQAHAEGIDTGIGDQPHLESEALAERIKDAVLAKKALDVRVLRVRELVNYTDWFVICSGRSDRQVAAIWHHVEDTIRQETGAKPMSVEGAEHNQWVLIDYGDVVLHVFYEPVRDFYQLEQLWREAPALSRGDAAAE